MSYAIEHDESLSSALARIAGEQSTRALESLQDARASVDAVEAGIHDARKRCKKCRGLARLVRPAIGEAYSEANAAFRDAAGLLSDARDAHAAVETFEHLVAASIGRDPDDPLMNDARSALVAAADHASRSIHAAPEILERSAHRIERGRAILTAATVEADARETIEGGLKKTYRRARRAMQEARDEPSPERFHEWRKRVKYGWYQVRLIEPSAPWLLGPLASSLHALSSTLGDAHDLAVLIDHVASDTDSYGGTSTLDRLRALARPVREDLERRALSAGARLHAEPPGAFRRRMGRYWFVWRTSGPEATLHELEDLAD